MKLYELKKEVSRISKELEEYIISSNTPSIDTLEGIRDKIKNIYGESQKIDAVSEYLIIDRHVLGVAITRASLLVMILSPKVQIDISLGILQRNIKPSLSQLSSKEILIEAVYLYIISNQQSQGIIEVVRMLRNKLQIKQAVMRDLSNIDRFIMGQVNRIVELKAKDLLPITQCETTNSLILALNTILELDNIKYIEDVMVYNVHPPVDVRNILRQLILIDSVEIASENLEVYYLVLQMLTKYIEMRKKKDLINSKDIIYEVLDDDCVGIMVRILEKESVPSRIRVEIMNILVESDIQTINYTHIDIDNTNLIPFIRYAVKNSDQIALLMEILEMLEIEITEEGNEGELSNLIVIMDFLNIILSTYTSRPSIESHRVNFSAYFGSNEDLTRGASPRGERTNVRVSIDNSISLEKYIGNSIIEVYNNIVPNITNPIIIYTYLTIFNKLIRDKGTLDGPHYYSAVNNRNLLLSHSANALGAVLRSLSMYIVQEEMLYVDVPSIKLYNLNSPYSVIRIGDASEKKDIVLESVQLLFFIILQLPEQIRSTISTSYILNIVFRAISKEPGAIPEDILAFIRGFFTAPILHKLANSLGGNLYAFISILIDKGELETVYNLVQNSSKLYKGILYRDILTDDSLMEYKENNILYSLLSTMLVQYYTENRALNNSAINKKIVGIYNAILNHMKKYSQMSSLLKESREFGYFFKILCVAGKVLDLDCCEMLRVMLSATGNGSASVEHCQGSLLYNSSSRNISELYYFYHFVYKGVKLSDKLSMHGIESSRDRGLLCINELQNTFSSNTLKYLALISLEGSDIKEKSHIKMYKNLDLPGISANERTLFVNQIYRSLFLSGRIQSASFCCLNVHRVTARKDAAEKDVASKEGPSENNGPNAGHKGTEYSYADMAIRSAIKATRETGVPHTLPHSVLAVGAPHLVAALLYILYNKSPNSAIVLAYIKKMRKYAKNDNTVFSRMLSSIVI